MRTLRKKKQYGKTAIACIIFFVTLFTSVSFFSMNTKAAGGTFDEASDEMNKIIRCSYCNINLSYYINRCDVWPIKWRRKSIRNHTKICYRSIYSHFK